MIALFFLVMTTCDVNAGTMADNCNDYILDGGFTFADCQKAMQAQPYRTDLYSLRCDRGEPMEAK